MHERRTMEIDQSQRDRSQNPSEIDSSAIFPRVWMILIPFAVPFLILTFTCFEVLERTGPLGAVLAAPLLVATNMAYVALIWVLKKRNM